MKFPLDLADGFQATEFQASSKSPAMKLYRVSGGRFRLTSNHVREKYLLSRQPVLDTERFQWMAHTSLSVQIVMQVIQRWTARVLEEPESWRSISYTYINSCPDIHLPISIVIQSTGDNPVMILQYCAKFNPTLIRNKIG
jgi:hypothetical protein